MNLSAVTLANSWTVTAYVITVLMFVYLLRITPWYRLRNHQFHNLFFGLVVALLVMWRIKAGAVPALEYHFMGVTLLTLVLGWAYAIWALSLLMLTMVFLGEVSWHSLGINLLLFVILPATFSYYVHRLAVGRLPQHFFIYIFVNGFFNAALTMALMVFSTAVLLWLADIYAWSRIVSDYLVYTPLMMFPEAFFTGMLITLGAVFRPHWIVTYDDDIYIKNK